MKRYRQNEVLDQDDLCEFFESLDVPMAFYDRAGMIALMILNVVARDAQKKPQFGDKAIRVDAAGVLDEEVNFVMPDLQIEGVPDYNNSFPGMYNQEKNLLIVAVPMQLSKHELRGNAAYWIQRLIKIVGHELGHAWYDNQNDVPDIDSAQVMDSSNLQYRDRPTELVARLTECSSLALLTILVSKFNASVSGGRVRPLNPRSDAELDAYVTSFRIVKEYQKDFFSKKNGQCFVDSIKGVLQVATQKRLDFDAFMAELEQFSEVLDSRAPRPAAKFVRHRRR